MKMPSDLAAGEKEINDTHVEDVNSLKMADEKGRADYSGATAKTDPLEIKLVRKLDMRIMPIMWAMYFLNYVSDKDRFAYTEIYSNVKIRLIATPLQTHGSTGSKRISD
jgi:hypothetical protein